jgi:hypothetical protein
LTLVLLDTNAYLRLAKRIRPMLGVRFGQKSYVLTILKEVEDEVHKNPALSFKFPWFDDTALTTERLAHQVRLSADERAKFEAAQSVFRGSVLADPQRFTSHGRSPPSKVDCGVLAFGQIRPAMVVTDDLGMHDLAADFGLKASTWHGHELLAKMLTAKVVDKDLVRQIYTAMDANDDLPATWRAAKHTAFRKVFGAAPQD